MCGIMGYYCFGKKRPEKSKIARMFTLLENRGKDASGFAYIEDDALKVFKLPIRSSELLKYPEWQNISSMPKSMIFHTRLKTKGTPQNNMNNHPLFNKKGLCIVHNGQIYNDDDIIPQKSRDAKVDSEAILYLLEEFRDDPIQISYYLSGSYAVATIDERNPDQLTLIRKDNPIDTYYDVANDIFYFISESRLARSALEIKPLFKRGMFLGEKGYVSNSIPNNVIIKIGSKGIISEIDLFENYYLYEELTIQCPWCLNPTLFIEGRGGNVCDVCRNPINEEEIEHVYT